MNYSSVTDCKYVTEDGLYIGCQVNFDKLGTVYFTAYANDSEAHSREIYQRANSGEFGVVKEYVSVRIEPTLEQRKNQQRTKRNQLLSQLDALISNPLRWASIDEQEKDAIANYRLSLLAVPQQEGFPDNVIWPESPTLISANTISITPTIIL
jgi:hypothetical protein